MDRRHPAPALLLAFVLLIPAAVSAQSAPEVRRMFLKTRANPTLPVYLLVEDKGGEAKAGPQSPEKGGEAVASPAPDRPAVVLFTSTFGWTPVLKDTASQMLSGGHPVLGIETPEYFEKERDAETLAADLKTMRAFINQRAGRPAGASVILAGFAYGAEMVPYILNRAGTEGVQGILLVSAGRKGATVFRVSIQLKMDSPPGERFDVGQELARMGPLPTFLIQGALDEDAAGQFFTPVLRGPRRLVVVPGGDHQFREVRGAYQIQVDQGLKWIAASATPAPSPAR